jgi:general secretion pathway protein D
VRVIGNPTTRQTGGRIVVNRATNTLLFYMANPEEQGQLLAILRSIDRPAKSAMIEVTVAEVRTGDKFDLGIEWSAGSVQLGNGRVTGGTLGGNVISNADGLNLSFLNGAGAVRAKLNALASDNRARILSSPRVMARNGETATIQVGEEVPIITTQQSSTVAGTTGAAVPSVLQQIQYKQTGVMLRVKPVIYAGNRIEIEVQQEVSSAAETKTGVNNTPTFSTRKVETKLSIRDGATVALGGLISQSQSGGKGGVPFLKDLPLAGQLFRADTATNSQTELIVLITPYVVDTDEAAEQITRAMRAQLGSWAETRAVEGLRPRPASAPEATTLRPGAAAPPLPAAALQSGQDPAAAHPASQVDTATAAQTVATTPGAVGGAPKPEPTALKIELPPGGRPVTDPALLEEFRRAAGVGSLAPAAVPTPVAPSRVAAPAPRRVTPPAKPASAPSNSLNR